MNIDVSHVVATARKGANVRDAIRDALIAALKEDRTFSLTFNSETVIINPDSIIDELGRQFRAERNGK